MINLKKQIGINRFLSKRMLALLTANFLICFSLFAQQRTITGKVTDSTGETLVGVNVLVKGTSNGTATDIDGKFSILVNDTDEILSAFYIGYISQEVPIGEKSSIDFVLEKDVQDIDEVVVVGYGVQKKKLVTGATTQIKNEDFVKNNVTQIESALQGLTPGMSIVKKSGQPGSEFNITIRGLSSINGNGPLVLIDGVPGDFNMVNPSDVESVDVLKDAASAAIYGSRAANGVVLITTKKGTAGEPVITYDAYKSVSNIDHTIDILDAQEYAMIMNEAHTNMGKKAPFSEDDIAGFGKGTDWQQEALNPNAPSQSHYLGISGGSTNSTYSISFNYSSEEGIFDYNGKSKYEKLGFRINSQHQLKKYLKVGENLTYSHRKRRAMSTGNQYSNFIHDLLMTNPLFPVYDETQPDGFGMSEIYDKQANPIKSMHYNYNGINNYDDLIGNVFAEISIINGLKFRSDFGGTLRFDYNTNYSDTFALTPYDTDHTIPKVEQGMSRNFYYNFDNVLSYEKDFGEHNIVGLIGMNAQDGNYFKVNGSRNGFLSNSAKVIDNVTTEIDTTYIYGDYNASDSRFSYFGRISWNYKEKFMATASLRRDGSSRFGKENRFGYFPSISAGWVITQEDFMKDNTFLNFMKLRASWGQNGKEPADRFVYMAQVGNENRTYTFGGSRQVGISPIIFANPGLKWEASTQTNIGFDSRFLEDFRFTFDWYKKESNDWIMQTTVPSISGISGISTTANPYINGGNVVNSGVELELGFQKQIGELSIDLNANFAYNKNIVTDVPDSIIHGSVSVLYNGSEEFYRVQEGMPIGFFWGYETDGLFQTQEEVLAHVGIDEDGEEKLLQKSAEPGDVRRVNRNGDDKLNDEDKTMIGDPNPDYIYGFRMSFAYKGFDLSMNIQGQGGNQIVQSYRSEERFFANYTTTILDRWQEDINEDTNIPRVTLGNERNKNWRNFSDLYVQDGDFLKIKSVNLGYNLKESILKNTPIKQMRIYVAASNLLTITKYNGLDPEIGYGSYYDSDGKLQDAYASGIDVGFYPSPRTYLIGVNVKF